MNSVFARPLRRTSFLSGSISLLLVWYAEAGRQIVEAIEKGSYEIFIGGDARIMSRLARLNQKNAAGLIYKNMKGLLASMN